MVKKKTILLVAPYYPPHSGGLERYVEEVALGLDSSNKWKVVVLTTSENNKESIQENGDIKIHRLKYNLKISNTPLSASWLFKVRKIIKEINPDIVNVHTPVPGLGDIASFLTPRKTPLVVTYHSGSMKKVEFLKYVLIFLYESVFMPFMLRKARKIICS